MVFKTMRLGDVLELRRGFDLPKSKREKGCVPVYSSSGISGYHSVSAVDGPCLVTGRYGTIGQVFYSEKPCWPLNTSLYATEFKGNNSRFLYYFLKTLPWESYATASAVPGINRNHVNAIPVCLPDLECQVGIASLLGALDDKIALNNRLNGYLAALGETMATRCSNEADGTLDDICSQSKETVSLEAAQLETYVSTENLLPNKAGLQLSAGLPTSGKVTRYRKGDTLVANIRPYFKKIWYATDEGTCSGDVIVFRANDARYAPYVFFSLCRDEFFEYVMLGAKGTKMPRGDKKQMMTFPICTNCNSTDLQLLHELANMIGTNHAESRQLMRLRDTLLPKLMSGEIDVSKVDLTQLNSHLAQIRKLNDAPLATTDLGFRFDRSHYTPLLYNPSSSQQQ